MSEQIIDAVLCSQYSKLLLFMRHNYNFKIKSKLDNQNILMVSLNIQDPRRRFKMLRFLLKQNLVDILEQDKNGHDIFFICVMRELETEFNYLVKNYITELDLSRSDIMGKTLLHHAVFTNNISILRSVLSIFAKFRINVDIPDKITKITPYLLACRLNHFEAAQMILEIGNASKNQADQTSFFNGERWKTEGQIEILNNYLKINELQINKAKLNGKLKVFQQLKNLSNSLNYEAQTNPEILPVLTKSLNRQIVYDGKNDQFVPLVRLKQSTSDRNSYLNRSKASTQSSSTPTSVSNFSNSSCFLRSGSRHKLEWNCLLQMNENSTQADQYFNSKSEKDIELELSSFNLTRTNKKKQTYLNSSRFGSQFNTASKSINLNELFDLASAQNSDSYRKAAKYTPVEPILNARRNSKVKQRPRCVSTFKLITIDEEKKSSVTPFRRNSKLKITT